MRIRHVALVLIGAIVTALVVYAAAPGANGARQVLDDGTISITASEEGLGAWVPYTITVRNLGDGNFSGRLLMVKRLDSKPGGQARLQPRGGAPGIVSPLGTSSQGTPPDGGYQFPVALSPRHKKTYTFFAPDTFTRVVVEDGLGTQVAEGQVDDRKSIAVGTLTDLPTLVNDLEAIRIGDLTARVSQWDAAHPFPETAARLSGFSAVVIDRYDTGRLSHAQLQALSDFVALGGELVLAGGADLVRTTAGLPARLVPFAPVADTALESLAPVAQLSGLRTDLSVPVAGGTAAAGARLILDAEDGRALEAEIAYGSGWIVELMFDPEAAASGGAASGLPTVAFTQAIARGLFSLHGDLPRGRTLIDPSALPPILFPSPADSPFPPLWLVAGLLALYLVLVLPVNYLVVRRLGRPALMWATVPALAVVFTLASYFIGQALQNGIRDREFQFFRAGPGGVLSRVDVHGLIFPTRGEHRISFGGDELVAPYTIDYPDTTPSCPRCTFPPSSGAGMIEEHVVPGAGPEIIEKGLVYGSVRVVASATTGHGGLDLDSHLWLVSDRLRGTVVNRGKVPVQGLLAYVYYEGGYRAALLTQSLPSGQSVQVDEAVAPISDGAPMLLRGSRLSRAQMLSIVADQAGRMTITHPGELAIVGFLHPSPTHLAVDGVEPAGSVLAVFGLPAEIESAQGRLGEVAYPRLAGSVPDPSAGLLQDTYDISLPAAIGPFILRYDQRLYSDVEVYDWSTRSWRSGQFTQDPATPLVQLGQLDAVQVRQGLVRVRLHELNLTWGSAMTIRFPGELP